MVNEIIDDYFYEGDPRTARLSNAATRTYAIYAQKEITKLRAVNELLKNIVMQSELRNGTHTKAQIKDQLNQIFIDHGLTFNDEIPKIGI